MHTDVFEGPLDLLLYLVQRDGVDLKRLAVAQIADAYLEYLDHMRELNLSLAGEYLVMAATLVHLKSLDLLPRAPTQLDEDAPDPRDAFARQLREYARYREAADALAKRPWLGREQFARREPDAEAAELTVDVDAFGLLEVYRALLVEAAAPEPQVAFEHMEHIDMGEAAVRLLRVFWEKGGSGELTEALMSLPTRALRVVTFIGVLEMLKLGWIVVEQRFHLGAVQVDVVVGPERADPRALSGWVSTEETA